MDRYLDATDWYFDEVEEAEREGEMLENLIKEIIDRNDPDYAPFGASSLNEAWESLQGSDEWTKVMEAIEECIMRNDKNRALDLMCEGNYLIEQELTRLIEKDASNIINNMKTYEPEYDPD